MATRSIGDESENRKRKRKELSELFDKNHSDEFILDSFLREKKLDIDIKKVKR